MNDQQLQIIQGDVREVLGALRDASVQTIVTSVPYWMARQYTDDPREIGHEATPAAYVAVLVEVFMLCWRVLRDDGTLWLNIGDRYSSSSTYNAPLTWNPLAGCTRKSEGCDSCYAAGMATRLEAMAQPNRSRGCEI